MVTREEELHYTKLLVRILPYCFKTLELTFVPFTNTKLCALCDSQEDLQLTVSPWLLCGLCRRFEERKERNYATCFAWEEVMERFKLKNLTVNLKDLNIQTKS